MSYLSVLLMASLVLQPALAAPIQKPATKPVQKPVTPTPKPSPAVAKPAQPAVQATPAQIMQSLMALLRNQSLDVEAFRADLRRRHEAYAAQLGQAAPAAAPAESRDAQGNFLSDYGMPGLDAQARRQAFFIELWRYAREARVGSRGFEGELRAWLTASAAPELHAVAYDFVILPDERILLAALDPDAPVDKPAGLGPSHAILASGGPVKAAGRLLMYSQAGKRLIFVSHHSDFYRPDYASLVLMQQRLIAAGAAAEEIFLIPAP